ncbi:MAG TPA: glycosyltransferase family 4 protein [Phycisphaerae bacterium]|nr:glycosyltransferase family 4 protein [Phycisphaerae bacterium]HRR85198.1 glycosyltransferase family 4 protein [Phycisphaerae bacterium]
MRLLVPLPFDVSNLAHGRNLRIAHVLPALQSNCEVLCVASNEHIAAAARRVMPGVEVQVAGRVKGGCPENHAFHCEPFLVRRSLSFLGYDEGFAEVIARLGVSADVVAGFDMPSVAPLLAAAETRGENRRPRIVCDLIDDPWLLHRSATRAYRRSLTGMKAAAAMQVVRCRVLSRFDALTAVAPQDASRLARVSGRPAVVVPNGVEASTSAAERRPREPLVVFTGNMSFPANETAACFVARKVWPLVLASYRCGPAGSSHCRVPTLAIVGANPTPDVCKLANLSNVTVTGWVPSVRDWLERAQTAVVPMLGGTGIKNKILEACAAGCPVVATSIATGGLPVGEDFGIIIADGPERIAAELLSLLVDPTRARRIGSAGLDMVRARFSWSRVAVEFLAVLRGETAAPADSDGGSDKQDETYRRCEVEEMEALTHAPS